MIRAVSWSSIPSSISGSGDLSFTFAQNLADRCDQVSDLPLALGHDPLRRNPATDVAIDATPLARL